MTMRATVHTTVALHLQLRLRRGAPLLLQTERRNPTFDVRAIQGAAARGQNACDVTPLSLGATRHFGPLQLCPDRSPGGAMTKSRSWVVRGMPCAELANDPATMNGMPAASSRATMSRKSSCSSLTLPTLL